MSKKKRDTDADVSESLDMTAGEQAAALVREGRAEERERRPLSVSLREAYRGMRDTPFRKADRRSQRAIDKFKNGGAGFRKLVRDKVAESHPEVADMDDQTFVEWIIETLKALLPELIAIIFASLFAAQKDVE